MSLDQQDPEDPKIFGLYIGTVVANVDPAGVGRVRVLVPGLMEPDSPWCFPLGTLNGGALKRGAFFVPPIAADVGILFLHGDIDHPYYIGGYWGSQVAEAADDGGTGTEVPTNVRDVPIEDRPKVQAIETESFLIYIDDREGTESDNLSGKKRLLILYKDDPENFIEIDGLNRAVQISGTSAVQIISSGLVDIRGLQVQIAGRLVNPLTDKEI